MQDHMTNEERSAAEVAAFLADAPGPYVAYGFRKPSGLDPICRLHHGDKIGTWMGDRLATVTEAREPFHDNLGGIRQNFRAKGINGATYAGTAYLSSGDYVRMRPVKP
jgi:hypothetical protein